MSETKQNFGEYNEQQNYDMQESDQHHLGINEFNQQHTAEVVPGEYSYAINESENQGLDGNEQVFTGNETVNNFGVVSEQIYPENECAHSLGEDQQGNQGVEGDGLKQEFGQNEASKTDNVPSDSHAEKKEGHQNNLASGGEEKKWPGWPGESVFRMLVPAQKVGNIIGRKGEYIKKMVEETRARIKILDGPPGSQERAVLFGKS